MTDGRRVLARIPLVLTQALPAVSGLTLAARTATTPAAIAVIIVLALALGAILMTGARRRGRPGGDDRERGADSLETA